MKRRRKKFLERITQPQRLVLLALSLSALLSLHQFVTDWQLQTLGLFLVLVCDNLFIYFYTDDFIADGIFTVPVYNLVASLAGNVLICLALYYSQLLSPFSRFSNVNLPFLLTKLFFVFVTLIDEK